MKAAVIEAFGKPLKILDVPEPSLTRDGAILRVKATGICRSDWHGWMGHDADVTLPHVPGHELSGIVEQVGADVGRVRPGDRVTVPFSGGCGQCPQCRSGFHNICDAAFQPGFTGWGSFAQFVAIRYADTNLIRLPDELDHAPAAVLGCRFMTAFRAVVARGRPSPGDWVAVHGCGGVGLSAIMIADAIGANVVGVDISEQKLEFAKSVGATALIHAGKTPNIGQAVKDLTGGGAHVSLDALGSVATCRNSILGLRKRGRHIQVGLMVAQDSNPPVPLDQVIAGELEILGSHGMQAHCYGAMLRMIVSGRLHPERLIKQTITLEESLRHLEQMDSFQGLGITVIDRF